MEKNIGKNTIGDNNKMSVDLKTYNMSTHDLSTVVRNTQAYRDWETDRKSTRLNSSHSAKSRMPSSA